MKTTTAIFLFLLSVAQAVPEFVGVMSTKEEGTKYAVRPTPNDVSRWVKQGDVFDGYVVSDYRVKDEVLVLNKDGQTFQLRMKDAKVRESVPASESVYLEAAKKVIVKMDKWETDVVYQVIDGQDGYWYVYATKVINGNTQMRRVRLTPQGIAKNYSVLSPLGPDERR
jgi:hypothetical protein